MSAELLDKLLTATIKLAETTAQLTETTKYLAEITAAMHRERVVIAKKELDDARADGSNSAYHFEQRHQALMVPNVKDSGARQ
jgi:hypothetical protein